MTISGAACNNLSVVDAASCRIQPLRQCRRDALAPLRSIRIVAARVFVALGLLTLFGLALVTG
jgi:hypothetical protein